MSGLPTLDPAVQLALRAALALLFLSAAAHKLRDRADFRAALANYRLLPDAACGPAATALALVELGVAGGLLAPGAVALASAGAVLLLALYSGAIAANLARGRRSIDCGCAGPGRRRPLGPELLVRNALLAGAAALCALPSASRALGALDAFTVAAATATLALLYAAVDTSLANARALREAS